jgi:hypothetical protein
MNSLNLEGGNIYLNDARWGKFFPVHNAKGIIAEVEKSST